MRDTERLRKLKEWVHEELCKGRSFKAPDPSFDLTKMRTGVEPSCFLGWIPSRPDSTGYVENPINVAPCILIMPGQSYAKNMEEQRFDRYSKIHRPEEMGQTLSVQMLFSIYEPGVRLPGFVEGVRSDMGHGVDMELLLEGTEQGLYTLHNWMSDAKELLLGIKAIPGTDLILDEVSLTSALYSDQAYVSDKRPMYYGFMSMKFNCFAIERVNEAVERLLE